MDLEIITPEDCAKDLFTDHYNVIVNEISLDYDLASRLAKQHVLVTVNSVLKRTPMYTGNLNPVWKFWNDVKEEIEEL